MYIAQTDNEDPLFTAYVTTNIDECYIFRRTSVLGD